MALVRAVALKDFTVNALSTTANAGSSAYSTVPPNSGETLYAGLHITSPSTGRAFVGTVQSASSSGFGTKTTEITFALSSARGSTWQTLAAPSTDRSWRRFTWTLSTAASTAGSWNGLAWIGFRNPQA